MKPSGDRIKEVMGAGAGSTLLLRPLWARWLWALQMTPHLQGSHADYKMVHRQVPC